MNQHEIVLPSIPELLELYPCNEAVEWLEGYTDANIAWQECPRSDWLIWVLQRTNQLTPMLNLAIQLKALETPLGDGRKVLDLITDERSLAFIELKKRRLAGEEVSEAIWCEAARAAAYAAARAAAYATVAVDAAYTARAAAHAACTAAADDAANAVNAANAAKSWQANSTRSLVTVTI